MTGPIEAVHDLSAAFARRDLAGALACFVPGDDVGYAGSELGEAATGRAALASLLGEVFGRDEAYAWQVTGATVHEYGPAAYVFTEAQGRVRTDTGDEDVFPYRVSGVVELVEGRWLWRHCLGGEPAG